MHSPNILHTPLNPDGAMEMGLSPCEACTVGWFKYDGLNSDSCHNGCQWWAEYKDKDEMALIQVIASR